MHFILLSKELSSAKGVGAPCQLVGLGPGSSAALCAGERPPNPTCLLPALAWAQPVMPPGTVAQQGVAECTPAQVNRAAAWPLISLLMLQLRLCRGHTGVCRPGLRERYLESSPAVQLIKAPEAMLGSPFVVLGPVPLPVLSAYCLQGEFASPLCQMTTLSTPPCQCPPLTRLDC